MRLRRHAAALAACAAITGCATAPVDQIRHFSQAFDTVSTVGQPLLDDLALAEKALGRQNAETAAKAGSPCPPHTVVWQPVPPGSGFIRGLCASDATYYSDLADPPATAQLRHGLKVIESYAQVLSDLADGRNAEQAMGELDALGRNVGALLTVAGAGAQATAIGAAALPLKPLLEQAARAADAKQARALILQGAPHVSALIASLRDAVPEMFRVLISRSATRLTAADASNAAVSAPELARIEAYRKAVADYTVLLGKLQHAWDLTAAAAAQPSGQRTLATLVEQTALLKADAEAARKVFAALRAGLPAR